MIVTSSGGGEGGHQCLCFLFFNFISTKLQLLSTLPRNIFPKRFIYFVTTT